MPFEGWSQVLSAYAAPYTAKATENYCVTIYDLGKTIHLDCGWVDPGAVREWQAVNESEAAAPPYSSPRSSRSRAQYSSRFLISRSKPRATGS